MDAPGNEIPAVATNETPVVATSAMPVEQSNDTGVASNNEMSITVPPHLLAMTTTTTTNLTVQIDNYEPLLPEAYVKLNGKEIQIVPGNEAYLQQGPAFFKWAVRHLVPPDMIQTIQSEAPLEAPKLKTLVRGIRPRVDAKANPREGEPTDYMLVLGDIIQANDPRSKSSDALRVARQMFDKGKLREYKSASMCNIVHDGNGSVSLH